VQSIARLLQDGADAGEFSVADPTATAELLYSTLHGTADAALHRGGPSDPDRLITAAQHFARGAVGAPPSTRRRSGGSRRSAQSSTTGRARRVT